MRSRSCEHEADIVRWLTAGRPASPMAAHADTCAICRDIVRVSESLRVLSETTAERPALPDPVSLWWKAQLLQRWESERRANTPLDRMHHAELMAGVGGLVLFLRWIWPNLGRLFRPAAAEDVAAWASALSPSGLTPLILVAGLLATLTAIVAVHALLVED